MKKVEYWYWQLRSEIAPHEVKITQWLITEEEALLIDPNAVHVPGTLVVRELPETDEEKAERHRIWDMPPRAAFWPAIAALARFHRPPAQD